MKVLFSNPPWWLNEVDTTNQKTGLTHTKWLAGVRAGSRWPFSRTTRSTPDNFVFGDYLPYPFFMGHATTYAKKHTGADVRFRDSIALRESYGVYFDHLFAERYDYIFIESATPSWDHDLKLIRAIKQHIPETKLVLTGPIASLGAKLFDEAPVHAVIKGEYEKGSVRVIEGEEGLIEHSLLSAQEMNDAPFPYLDEVYAHRYWDRNPVGQVPPQLQVWTSRGCPYKCIFCVWPAVMTGNDPDGTGRRIVRHYTPDYMEAMLTEFTEKYEYKSVYFDDDTFNLGNSHVLNMSNVMKKIQLPWSAMCRADTSKMESWKVMQDSGCFGVKLGFESGNQYVVNQIVNKHLKLDYAAEVVRHLHSIGMKVHGTFTYGLPGETKEQMLDTKRFIASLPFDSYQESGTAEIEGTPLATLREEGKLDAYAGAVVDNDYVVETDGAQKWRELASELRAS